MTIVELIMRNILLIAIGVSLPLTCAFIYELLKAKRKPNVIYLQNDDPWIPIAQQEPGDVGVDNSHTIRYIFLSDGEKIDHVCSLRYNRNGQIIFGYDERIATHWRPFPEAPKLIKEKK